MISESYEEPSKIVYDTVTVYKEPPKKIQMVHTIQMNMMYTL